MEDLKRIFPPTEMAEDTVGIPSKKSKVSECSPYELSNKIFSQYGILRRIFSNLSAFDLSQCAPVSKLWRDVAKNTILTDGARRNKISVFGYTSLKTYQGPRYSEESLKGLSLQERRVLFRSPEHLQIYEEMRGYLQKLPYSPLASIGFMSGDPDRFFIDFFPSHKLIDEIIPKTCSSVTTTVNGIVGTKTETFEDFEVENIRRIKASMAFAFLPKILGLKIEPFRFEDGGGPEEDREESGAEADAVISSLNLDPEDRVKCVLALASSHQVPVLTRVLNRLKQENNQGRPFAIGGGMAYYPTSSRHENKFPYLDDENFFDEERNDDDEDETNIVTGFVFAASKEFEGNCKASSMILRPGIKKPETVLKLMKDWRVRMSSSFNPENSLGIMIACCGRGKNFYREGNVETSAFRSVFPKTQLVGMFSNGEIGLDFSEPDFENLSGSKNPKNVSEAIAEQKQTEKRIKDCQSEWSQEELCHSYSTVFLVISFNYS